MTCFSAAESIRTRLRADPEGRHSVEAAPYSSISMVMLVHRIGKV
jgi:hypothetical protein